MLPSTPPSGTGRSCSRSGAEGRVEEGVVELMGLIGLIGLIGSQKRQPPKGEALKRSTDIPRYIMCDAPALCEIGQGRRTNRSNRVSEKATAEGGGSQAIHGHPGYIMCDAPALCEIGQGRHTTYYTVRASTPRGGEPSLTRGEGYSVGTATRALPAETALMLLPLTQEEPRKKCASPSLG